MDEYPDYGDGARDCGCWDWVREGTEKAPWKGFFVTDADFVAYNCNGMVNADPQAYRWSSAKLLFDYTPYVTRSDWMCCLADARWMWQNHELRCASLKQSVSRTKLYAKSSDIWKHFQAEEWSRHPRLAEDLGVANGIGGESATEQLAAEEPYVVFRRSDWARNGIAAKLREMPQTRRKKYYAKVLDMVQCWPVPPSEMLWVGGTYARHPRYFPEHQNEHAWVYGRLRPLGIQPDAFLSKLHQAGVNRFAPIDLWHKIWDEDAMSRHFPGTLSDTVRAGRLCTYMETHKLHKSLWYGHELRNKHKHHISILDHPCTTRPLHLLTAPCHEEVVSASASCGFLDAEGIATERNPAAAHMQDESTDDEISGASDYGTLA